MYRHIINNKHNILYHVKLAKPLAFHLLKMDLKNGPPYRRQAINPRHQRPRGLLSCTARNSPVEYPNGESGHDINASDPVIIVSPVIILSTLLPILIQ